MKKRHQRKNEFYQWRPNWFSNSKNHQIDFRKWLIDHGADIYANLAHNELFKFNMNGAIGCCWSTGLCCPVFRKWLGIYRSKEVTR